LKISESGTLDEESSNLNAKPAKKRQGNIDCRLFTGVKVDEVETAECRAKGGRSEGR